MLVAGGEQAVCLSVEGTVDVDEGVGGRLLLRGCCGRMGEKRFGGGGRGGAHRGVA